MDGERLAARMADIDAMEARVNGAPDKEEAIIEEMVRLLDERDEARAEVRRLTAALATVTAERGEFLRSRDLADEYIARLRAQLAAQACLAVAAWSDNRFDGYDPRDVQETIEGAIRRLPLRALPLDAPGGAT